MEQVQSSNSWRAGVLVFVLIMNENMRLFYPKRISPTPFPAALQAAAMTLRMLIFIESNLIRDNSLVVLVSND